MVAFRCQGTLGWTSTTRGNFNQTEAKSTMQLLKVIHQITCIVRKSIFLMGLLVWTANSALAQPLAATCQSPQALEQNAFESPMTFARATSKGNMSTSTWIAAIGIIGPETPSRFRAFLESEQYVPGQIILHSPGGNLAAGLELGHLIRGAGLTAHIGRTKRSFASYDAPCDTWYDSVESGVCVSSCAYAFLGGQERFVVSPYYPTGPNLLGFHQFYGNPDRGSEMLTAEQVAQIEKSTMSIAQVLTGQIVLYAIEMGVDPRVVAFATATPSDNLYYPTVVELEELSIVSGSGLRPWFMEPYGGGLVTAARPHRSDSMLQQITAFCPKESREANFLITMDLATPSYPNPNDLPLNAVEITIDGQPYRIDRKELNVRYTNGSILIAMPVERIKAQIIGAQKIDFDLDAARVMGGFREGIEMGIAERQSLSLAWRNCI